MSSNRKKDEEKTQASRIGLFFGSFNPVHTGHLIIGQYFAEFADLDKVWYVLSPQNPFKANHELLPGEDRLQLLELAIAGNPLLACCDIELRLQTPSYTVHTLQALEEKYPELSFVLIMGSDNLESLPYWKDYKTITEGFDIYVYPRPGFQAVGAPASLGKRIRYVDAPLIDISSSFIRQAITSGKTPRYWLPEKVWETIKKQGYYQI